MDIRAENISNRAASLTEDEKSWTIPEKYYEALENCSLQLEDLFEHRYERIVLNNRQITNYLRDFSYFVEAFECEVQFLHMSLWAIDHFHVGVRGFNHVFWHMAGKYLLFGVDRSSIEHFFDPDTNEFAPDQYPFPPMQFHSIDQSGNLHSSKDKFDRSNPSSAQWNFYNGLRSPRAEQRDRFQALYHRLESNTDWFENGNLENGDDWSEDDFRSWDDLENEPVLASLEEVKATAGRPSKSSQDDRYAVMYAKVLMTRYYGDDKGKVPSRRSCVLKVAVFLEIPEHNLIAFHKRIDRKLKRKMAMRNLEQ